MTLKKVDAHAKINLTLHIAARRPDGYHDIETVMVPIRLCDVVTVEKCDGIYLSCDSAAVPSDERNIAYKAARLFFDETGIYGGAKINIEKKIPVCGGLGGGSSDAAAVLNALNELYSAKLSADERRRMALMLGSDVPFFIEPCPAFCTGRGEIITPLEDNSSFGYSVCAWGEGVSTAMMYAEADKGRLCRRSSDGVIKALRDNDTELLAASIFNDFEPFCNALRPKTLTVKNEFLASGAVASCLSGSGISVFGVFENQSKADEAEFLIRRNISKSL